jgi:octopamine/tyramine receptor
MSTSNNITVINNINNNNETIQVGLTQQTAIFFSILFSIILILTLVGNSLVIYVITRVKCLQTPTNYILLSLACTDISLSILVMIPAMIQDIRQEWIFPKVVCKFYCAFDITCCTASILHLLLVALDRYTAILYPYKYERFFRLKNVFITILFVWALSLGMSFIPIFNDWNRSDPTDSPLILDDIKTCFIEANVTYAIISSSLSFYLPLVFMSIVYVRIFFAARRQVSKLNEMHRHTNRFSRDINSARISQSSDQPDIDYKLNNSRRMSYLRPDSIMEQPRMSTTSSSTGADISSIKKASKMSTRNRSKSVVRLINIFRIEERRISKDNKAIKTLGIIMGKI